MTQQKSIENFVARIRQIEPLAKIIAEQKQRWQTQLDNAQSLDDINHIEDEISTQHDAIAMVYDTLVTYPTDESEAGALIDYLEKNRDLLKIMQTFDYHESLMDDLLNARARLTVLQED